LKSRIASVKGNSSTISPASSVTSSTAFNSPASGAFGFEQFPDHGPRDFPGAIGIAQLVAFGVGNQLIADARVEEIPRHEPNPLELRAPAREPATAHEFFIRNCPMMPNPGQPRDDRRDYEPVDPA